ncbi:MAG TPA: hypothetical protein VD999_05180 [Vitreimonas sp.]|nr:hypothetical protein [Vitreimonas sp.]
MSKVREMFGTFGQHEVSALESPVVVEYMSKLDVPEAAKSQIKNLFNIWIKDALQTAFNASLPRDIKLDQAMTNNYKVRGETFQQMLETEPMVSLEKLAEYLPDQDINTLIKTYFDDHWSELTQALEVSETTTTPIAADISEHTVITGQFDSQSNTDKAA